MDELPIVFARQGIEITLAQKALVIRTDQLVDSVWIPAVFAEVPANGASILHAPFCRFELFIAAQVSGDGRRCNRKCQQHENQQEENSQKNKAVFLTACGVSGCGPVHQVFSGLHHGNLGLALSRLFHAFYCIRGKVWVL